MDTVSATLIVMSALSIVMTVALIIVTIIQAIILQNVSRITQELTREALIIIARMDERVTRTHDIMADLISLKQEHIKLTEAVFRNLKGMPPRQQPVTSGVVE